VLFIFSLSIFRGFYGHGTAANYWFFGAGDLAVDRDFNDVIFRSPDAIIRVAAAEPNGHDAGLYEPDPGCLFKSHSQKSLVLCNIRLIKSAFEPKTYVPIRRPNCLSNRPSFGRGPLKSHKSGNKFF
jgi:hypothetical protein